MNVQLLHKETNQSLDNSVKTQFVKGHTNGVLFSFTFPTNNTSDELKKFLDTKLKIKYVTDRSEVLIPSVKIKHFVNISNLELGATGVKPVSDTIFRSSLKNVLKSLTTDNTIQESIDSLDDSENKTIMFYVDLGSLTVGSGRDLHVELIPDVVTGLTADISISAISKEIEPFHFFKYDLDFDRNEIHKNTLGIYLCSDDDITQKDIDLQIDSDTTSFDTDLKTLVSASNVFNRIESELALNTIPVFSAITSLPEDVHLRLSEQGTQTEVFSLIKRVFTDAVQVVLDAEQTNAKFQNVKNKLQSTNPELLALV